MEEDPFEIAERVRIHGVANPRPSWRDTCLGGLGLGFFAIGTAAVNLILTDSGSILLRRNPGLFLCIYLAHLLVATLWLQYLGGRRRTRIAATALYALVSTVASGAVIELWRICKLFRIGNFPHEIFFVFMDVFRDLFRMNGFWIFWESRLSLSLSLGD